MIFTWLNDEENGGHAADVVHVLVDVVDVVGSPSGT